MVPDRWQDVGVAPMARVDCATELPRCQRQRLQALLDATFLRRRSCDRRGPLPRRLRLRRAVQAPGQEDFDLWRALLREEHGHCERLAPEVRTAGFGREARPPVDEDVNAAGARDPPAWPGYIGLEMFRALSGLGK